MSQIKSNRWSTPVFFILLIVIALFVLFPIMVVLINSFKSRFIISSAPFAFPNSESFVGFENY
ncbi:MAG: carbohydrate ABC transporter permease, partial [Spirochaetales bacterium]|nr:carbohydrate ABC transporter permease [Spirochaetales bacterium]